MPISPGADSIEFKCVHCQGSVVVSAEKAGTDVACPHCLATQLAPVPALPATDTPPAALLSSESAPLTTPRPESVKTNAAEPMVSPISPMASVSVEPLTERTVSSLPPMEGALAQPVNAAMVEVPTAVAQTTSEHPVNAGSLSQGMVESHDPSAPAFEVQSSPPAPIGGRAFTQSRPVQNDFTQPPKSPARKIIAAFTSLCFIGVIGAVGISISNGIERAKIENEIDGMMNNAQAAFIDNDAGKAAELAKSAEQKIKGSPQTLDEAKIQSWGTRIKHFIAKQAEVEKLDSIFAGVDKDLSGVRSQLENHKLLQGAPSNENRPVLTHLDKLLAEVSKKEIERKTAKLKQEVAESEKLYREGKIEAAADRAAQIERDMAANPKVQDSDIEKSLQKLTDRAAKLKEAKAIRVSAHNGNFAEQKRKLQSRIDALDETSEDLKPLAESLRALRSELLLEEKRSRKLSAEDKKDLSELISVLVSRDNDIASGQPDGDTMSLTYRGKVLKLGFQRTLLAKNIFVEVGDNRFLIDPDEVLGKQGTDNMPAKPPRPGRVMAHVLALGDAMKKAGVHSDEIWSAIDEAPFVSARRSSEADGRVYLFLRDRLYSGKLEEKTLAEREEEGNFKKKAEALATKLENDTSFDEDLRKVVAVAVQATYTDASWFDHLPGEYVRRVVAEGYVESQIPEAAVKYKKELAEFREAYAKISKPTLSFTGSSEQGDDLREMKTYDDHSVWRIYDKAANQTTFALKNPDDEKDALFILYDFPGKQADFPADWTPKTIRMTHQAVGVTASYDVAAKKFTTDESAFKTAASLEMSPLTPEYRTQKGLGEIWWSLPPHVLLVDRFGHTTGIVTPNGRLDITDFNQIKDPQQRKDAMDAYLDQIAKVLPSPPYLHLFFRYFFEYILDSPITSKPWLLGSRAHSGDIHQTAYQSLERLQGGRYVGDCDDLAETFMNLTRRQGKLSYVMALPQHAACGWCEKSNDHDFTFHVLDTGPPRIFKNSDLDKVIESAYRAYDEDKTMRFDPKSLGFLFRFNGEPTRTPYWLSSRMFVDREYGEVMERVQSYWHFHFYALGIKTMSEMIQKGDRVPENCIELAGLYGQVREVEDSVHWTQEAIKQFGPEDKLSRFNEEFRVGVMWRDEHGDNDRDNQRSYDAIKHMLGELRRLQNTPESNNYISTRLELSGLLTSIDKPWEAWALVKPDMFTFASRGMLKIEHAASLTSAYVKMKDLIKKGKVPTDAERDDQNKLEELLTWFYEKALFEAEDDFSDYMRKYSFVGEWYTGKYGHERLTAELLKNGPFPDPAKPRNHSDRKNPEEEDWNWIRLSLSSYSIAIADALDFDQPPEKWRREEAVKLADQMMKAGEQARKFGSLGSSEFQMLSTRVFRAFIIKDWADLEKVLVATEKQDWARLTTDIAETFGRCARFVTPEEFAAQYRKFTQHIKARTAYYTVVYEAYRGDAFEQALAASKIAVECNPHDPDMERENIFLAQLVSKRLDRQKAKSTKSNDAKSSSLVPVPPPSQPAKNP